MSFDNESIGYLVVSVTTANGALPVADALVLVYEGANGEGADAVYTLRTDKMGKTQRVALKALPAELSQNYGSKNNFKTYSVYTYADGYYYNTYTSVPIFQGITSIQPVELIPLSEYATPYDDVPNNSRRYQENPDENI
jgi:hypothetical protein